MIWEHGGLRLTDSTDKLNPRRVYELLQQTYWGVRRPWDTIERIIQHSMCFSLLDNDAQIGFGRVVTDYTVFSWLSDIVIDPEYRSRGLGKWMVSCILEHPDLRSCQFVLQTRDAHGLYEPFGFSRAGALMSTAVPGL